MSAARLQLTPAADADLESIWRFVAERSGPTAANRLETSLHQSMSRIMKSPSMGSLREDLAATSIRLFPHRPCLIAYRERADGIEVLRVLHAARDVDCLAL